MFPPTTMIEELLNCPTMVSWSVQVNILNKHYVDNISCLYGTVHGTQNILSVHIICFPRTTMIEQLLNCPTMASRSQLGFVQVNIPNELNFIRVIGTLQFTQYFTVGIAEISNVGNHLR